MAQSQYPFKFLAELDDTQRKTFERLASTLAVSKNEEIIGHGSDNADRAQNLVFFIVEGRFKVLIYSPSGREVPYRILGPGDQFGELAALDGGPRTASVIALTPGKLMQLSGDQFEAFLRASPGAALALARDFARQIRALTDRVFSLTALNVANRIHAELLRMGYEAGVQDDRARVARMPIHEDFAALLGTQREAVTRELGALEKMKLISRKGRELVILQVDALKRLVRQVSGEEFGVGSDGPPGKRARPAAKRRRKS